jgi:hypothetical protein
MDSTMNEYIINVPLVKRILVFVYGKKFDTLGAYDTTTVRTFCVFVGASYWSVVRKHVSQRTCSTFTQLTSATSHKFVYNDFALQTDMFFQINTGHVCALMLTVTLLNKCTKSIGYIIGNSAMFSTLRVWLNDAVRLDKSHDSFYGVQFNAIPQHFGLFQDLRRLSKCSVKGLLVIFYLLGIFGADHNTGCLDTFDGLKLLADFLHPMLVAIFYTEVNKLLAHVFASIHEWLDVDGAKKYYDMIDVNVGGNQDQRMTSITDSVCWTLLWVRLVGCSWTWPTIWI